MLHIKYSEDYQKRWPIAQGAGLIRSPSLKATPPSSLKILDREALTELSFIFFTGWLFTGILNRSKELIRLSLLPLGTSGESSVLVLYHPETHLASPSRMDSEIFDSSYFVCPLDRAGGGEKSPTQMHLCPVVNKLRYNLAHARPDGSVEGLKEPDRTQYCCESRKAKLWAYLNETVRTDPELYGPMIGGRAFPINLPFAFLERYLTGIEVKNLDLGKLLEETLLWFAMASSDVIMGFPHVTPAIPIAFNEIDLLLYEAAGDFTGQQATPDGGWEAYLNRHAVCLMEFTIGHHAEMAKGGQEVPGRPEGGLGKDVPKNKLMNFYAFRSYEFKLVHGNYFTVTGEANLAPPTKRTLSTTAGFNYRCLSDECGANIEQLILQHHDTPVPVLQVRSWHGRLIEMVEQAGRDFRAAL